VSPCYLPQAAWRGKIGQTIVQAIVRKCVKGRAPDTGQSPAGPLQTLPRIADSWPVRLGPGRCDITRVTTVFRGGTPVSAAGTRGLVLAVREGQWGPGRRRAAIVLGLPSFDPEGHDAQDS